MTDMQIQENTTEKGNEQLTIASPNFAVVVAEVQQRVREGWFIVDQPVCYVTLYEVMMERSRSSVVRAIERLNAIKDEGGLSVGVKKAAGRPKKEA